MAQIIVSNDGSLLYTELDRMWKQAVVVQFDVLSPAFAYTDSGKPRKKEQSRQ
jgi:hypothetical protein